MLSFWLVVVVLGKALCIGVLAMGDSPVVVAAFMTAHQNSSKVSRQNL